MIDLRVIPSIEELRQRPPVRALETRYGRSAVVSALREETAVLRDALQNGTATVADSDEAAAWIERALGHRLARALSGSLRRVVNATGVIIHTNLGRAPLGAAAAARLADIATGYSNLEYLLEEGRRGSRHTHADALLRRLTGAEAALVVNNNAAAVLLVLAALAEGREVIISRGELVEIGGGFRIPDVMRQSGAMLREVGTTNKTRAADYAAAIGDRTAAMLRVHPSNFRMEGFTERPPLAALVELARRFDILLVEDLGSGYLGAGAWGLGAGGAPAAAATSESASRGAAARGGGAPRALNNAGAPATAATSESAPAARAGVGPRPNQEMTRGAAARGDSLEPPPSAHARGGSLRGWGPASSEKCAPRALNNARAPALAEPAVRASVDAGVDVCCFSGDKLLGGPQAGIIVGRRAAIERVRRHPLMRALRVDKLTYAALEATLLDYATGRASDSIPVARMIAATIDALEARAQAIVSKVTASPAITLRIVDGLATIGGGSAPGLTLPSKLLALTVAGETADALEGRLRQADPPIVARIEHDQVLLDLRTIQPDEDDAVTGVLNSLGKSGT